MPFFIITVTFIFLCMAGYFCLRMIFPLSLHWLVKSALVLLTVLVMANELLFRLLSIHVSDAVAGVLAWFLLSIILSVTLFFVFDILRLLLRLFGKKVAAKSGTLACYGLACVLSSYGMYEAFKVPEVTHVTLRYKDLPSDLQGLKIAQLSDSHVGRFFREGWLDTSFERILEQNPDIIMITGDAVDAPIENAGDDARPYEKLIAPLGVYFVAGNHEYLNGYSEWIEYFRALPNLTILENAHRCIVRGDAVLELIGITDPAAKRVDADLPSAMRALNGLPDGGEKSFRILLSHRPSDPETDLILADLQLSGHTHGGMMLPIKALVAKGNGGFVGGLYELAYGKLFVSNGMGIWDGLPVRLGVPSEMTIITLEKE